jgi:hypothetical protein
LLRLLLMSLFHLLACLFVVLLGDSVVFLLLLLRYFVPLLLLLGIQLLLRTVLLRVA